MFTLSLNAQESFEGKITYKVEVELKYVNHDWNDHLSKKWGDTLEVYHHEEGFQKRIYKNSFPNGFSFNIYDVRKNEYYVKWHSIDTIYFYGCSEMATDFVSIEEMDSKEILGKESKSVLMKMYTRMSKDTIEARYFYDENIPMNPDNYKQFKDTHLDVLYETIKGHIMEWSIDTDICKITFTAIKVEEMDMPIDFFRIPENIPLKRI